MLSLKRKATGTHGRQRKGMTEIEAMDGHGAS